MVFVVGIRVDDMAFRPVGRLVVPFRCCSNSRLLCSLQSEHLIKSTHYSRPEVFKLDDQSFVPDEKWNLSQAVIHMLERRLLNEKDNPLRLLKQSIIDYVHKNYRKPGSCSPKFTVCDNMSRVVSIWENFDSLLTPVDHVSRRPTDTYYVNETHCLRAHTSAHQYELFKQGNIVILNYVVYFLAN
ncbi:hypothetical protein AB6A40_010425 [Gnathostoma spinigerum]|uniref:Phenylalanyl-tRNA synthetase domain-containing protein n=1 Tax=Gnathostoma spinigerum TaxID=75299 RepID=A0ABD6EWI6_9BILA